MSPEPHLPRGRDSVPHDSRSCGRPRLLQEGVRAEETMRFPCRREDRDTEIRSKAHRCSWLTKARSRYAKPPQLGGTTVTVSIYFQDVDAVARRAEGAGATVLRPFADQFYGERSVNLKDPFGPLLAFSTVNEKLTVEEMRQRMPA